MPIYIGMPAIDRPADIGSQRTYVNKGAKSTIQTTITKIEIWTNSAMTDAEVATFYEGVTNQLTTRDTEYIGAVSAGSKQTFTVSLNVEVGDCIGIYWSDLGVGIEQSTSGFDGVWFKDGDHIPCANTLFSILAGDAISLRGVIEIIHYQSIAGNFVSVGSLGLKGTLVKFVNGQVSFVGSLGKIKTVYKSLSGIVSFIGDASVAKLILQALSGTLTFVGNLGISRLFYKAVAGTLAFVGDLKLSRIIKILLTGIISFTGLVKGIKKYVWTLVNKVKEDFTRVDKEKDDWTPVDKEKEDWDKVKK